MRELKFRALTKKNNVMVFGDLISCPNREHRIIWFEIKGELPLDVDYNDFNEVVQSGTIGQFTGLKDKNEVDIYDGDIVNDDELGKGIVVFQSGCFFMMYGYDINMEFLGLKTDKFGRLQQKRIVEIIGNIHENPELLESLN